MPRYPLWEGGDCANSTAAGPPDACQPGKSSPGKEGARPTPSAFSLHEDFVLEGD
jgi:hypothetical protein